MRIPLKKNLGWAFLIVFGINPHIQAQSENVSESFPKKIILESDLTLVYEQDTSSQITVVQVNIKGGKRAEPKGKSGLAYLTTRLSLEIPDFRKMQKLMDQATQLFMECGEDSSFIRISCLSENLKDSLEVVSKIILKPLFSSIRIHKVKEQMERRRKEEQDEPANVAYLNYLSSFYVNTPYSSSIFGSEESLKAVKKKDITNFHQDHFNVGNMVIVVSTDLEEDTIKQIISQQFRKITEGPPRMYPAVVNTQPDKKLRLIDKGTQQTFISAGFLLPSDSTRDYVCSVMLQNFLGKGVASWLWPLRDKERLAYNIQSRFIPVGKDGILGAYLETENAKRQTAFKAFKDVLNTLHTEGLSSEELDTNKTFTKAHILRENETKRARVKTISSFETIGLGYDFFKRFSQTVDAITLEEMNTFIQKYLDPEKAVYVIIGPEKE